MRRIKDLFSDECGQDLVEYTMIVAVIGLASAAIFMSAGNGVRSIWTTANNQLTISSASGCGHDHAGYDDRGHEDCR